MAKFKMSVSHRLLQDEVLRRIRSELRELKNQFADKISDLREEWGGNIGRFSFSAMGFSVSGTLTVKASQVEFDFDLPLAATLFRGKIESTLRDRLQTLLA
jgi:hypothetical protein